MCYQLHSIKLERGRQDIQLPVDHDIVQVTDSAKLIVKAKSTPNNCDDTVVRTFEVIGCNETISAPNWKHFHTIVSGTFVRHVIEILPSEEASIMSKVEELPDHFYIGKFCRDADCYLQDSARMSIESAKSLITKKRKEDSNDKFAILGVVNF